MANKNDDQRPWMSRKILGKRLRAHREAAGKTRADVHAAQGGLSPAHLRSIEVGDVPIHVRNVKTLCDIYSIYDEETRRQLCDLGEATRKRGWYAEYSSVPMRMRIFVDVESAATTIYHYIESAVDGRFQTPEYARAITQATLPPGSPVSVDDIVNFRMTRKKKFWDSKRCRSLNVVLTENALTIQVGSREIQQAQIEHLVEMSERPGVNVSVVPRVAGPYFGMDNSLMIFDFDDGSYPSVAYEDDFVKSRYSDDITVVDQYRMMWRSAADHSVSLKRFVDDYCQ